MTPGYFFNFSYEVSHEKLRYGTKIFRWEGAQIRAQTVITIVQNAIVEAV